MTTNIIPASELDRRRQERERKRQEREALAGSILSLAETKTIHHVRLRLRQNVGNRHDD